VSGEDRKYIDGRRYVVMDREGSDEIIPGRE